MLDVESDGVRFLKIHGMGGVGKTTLAKVIFNKLYSSFDRCCFLADVRESSKSNDGLVNLQKKLVSKLDDSHPINQIYQVNDGINLIDRGVFKNKKVLIVLDDVDDEKQVKIFAKKDNWFGFGSRIIITTRNNDVLKEGPNVLAYEAHEMEFGHALELFSKHAFRRDYPPNHFVSLSENIVHTLGMLPLALEITGSSLIGKSKEVWMDTWLKLKEAPHMEVQEKLMISYEKLDFAQREIFLDIACFFVNEDKIYPFYMWADYNYHPHDAIDVLILKSLIKIKDNKTFWMHDQVRDLGREIIHRENNKHLHKRSRVWKRKEALSILKPKGSKTIEALSVGYHGSYVLDHEILTPDGFVNIRNLRFFEGKNVSFVGDFKNCLSNLRWLSWRTWHDMKFETTNFHLANLVVLDLSRSCVSEKWIGWVQIREARKLKVLDLSHCLYLKRTPNLSTWVCLERLVLEGCRYLIEIDHSIVNLTLLTILNLDGCNIRGLPKKIGCLQALTDFVMSPLEEREGSTISKQPSLKLPYSIGGLVKLTRLNLSRCIYIEELPNSIGELQSLIELDLSSTSVGHLPDSIGKLKQLKVLKMSNIKGITKLPSAIGQVEKLEELDARGCCNLTGEILEIGRLSRLRILDLSDTRISGLPTSMSHLSDLQKLMLEKCPELKQLPVLPPSLICLRWGPKSCWCSSEEEHLHEREVFWQDIDRDQEECKQEIERRAFAECGIAICLPTRIGALSQQEALVAAIPTSIGTLSQLNTLKLCCKNVRFLPQLPSSLRELQLRDLATMPSPDFSNLKNLSILIFYECSLEFSTIFDAESEELRVELCELRKVDAPLLLKMKRLRSLVMDGCEFFPKVFDLSRMKNLEKVIVRACFSLVVICGLEELGSLRSLSVDYCPSVERISDLSKLKKLRELEVVYCRKLKFVQGLNRLDSLKERELYGNGKFGGDDPNGFALYSTAAPYDRLYPRSSPLLMNFATRRYFSR